MDDINGALPDDDLEQPASPPRQPRVWTVFVSIVLALVAAIAWQVVIVVILVFDDVSSGADQQQLTQNLTERIATPTMFMLLAVGGQIAFGLAALIPARLSSEPVPQRLGLFRPQPSWHVYPLAMLGSLVPLAIGFSLAHVIALFLSPDPSVQMMYDKMTVAVSVPFVLFIALAPGFCEELFFRGYVQRRLLQRWSPAWAIGVTSVIFALMHVTPHAIAAVLPIGLWFGFVAWRCGSVGPCILCHAFVNGAVNAWRVVVKFGEIPDTAQHVFLGASLCVGLVCFVLLLKCFRNAESETLPHV